MSIPGETNPLPPENAERPDHGRASKNLRAKKQSSWKGRKTTASEITGTDGKLAREILANTNTPSPKTRKHDSSVGSTISGFEAYHTTSALGAEELAVRVENEWKKTIGEGINKPSAPFITPFLNNKHLFEALEIFLRKRGSILSSKESMVDFLMLFAGASRTEETGKLLKVAQLLIERNNPATCAFVYMCKESEAFKTIVKDLLPYSDATDFIYLFASNKEAIGAITTLLKFRKELLPVFFYTKYVKNSDDEELLKIGMQIGENDLFKRFLEVRDVKVWPHLITYVMRLPTMETNGIIARILDQRLPITQEMLRGCLTTLNYHAIDNLLKASDKQFIVDSKEAIFEVLMAYRDPHLGGLISKHAPYLAAMIDTRTLNTGAEEGNDWFIEWAIAGGRVLPPEEAAKLLPEALNAGNLRLIRRLSEIASKGNEAISYPENLLMDDIDKPGFRKEMVMHFALFSPLEEVYTLVAQHPQWAEALEQVAALLPLLVRFPTMQFAGQIGYRGRSLADYISGTMNYAEENRTITGKLLPMLSHPDTGILSRKALLESIVENRFSRLVAKAKEDQRDFIFKIEKLKAYSRFRKDETDWRISHSTPIYEANSKSINVITSLGPTVYTLITDAKPQRYSWSLKHLGELCYNKETNEWHLPSNETVDIIRDIDPLLHIVQVLSYKYTYTSDDGKRVELPTTKINQRMMDHTPHQTIQKLQDHLESLHTQLVSYDLDFANPESLKQFNEMIARGYWLIATLCETDRGTPHNAMIWLNLMYEHHKLPPPIPKIDHYFLDNTMIVTPLEKAIEKWETYFEPPLDVALEAKYGEGARKRLYRLLRQNGNLLRLCSPKVRDDDKLVERAIRSNPEAIRYASKRLQEL